MAKALKEIWNVDGIEIPVYIYKERRYNNRISITQKGVNIRIPKMGAKIMDQSYRSWAMQWLKKQVLERPDIIQRFKVTDYVNGHIVHTPFKDYVLEIMSSKRSTSAGKLIGNVMHLNMNDTLPEGISAKTIRTLMSRLIAKDQLPRVTKRIMDINNHYFKQPIKGVKIKNNSSNWGSCSSTGNINISTKTLLAPADVQDYIFVHELSHRIEMNHSPEYWAIVAKVMPSYKKHERWIKENGHLCEL